MRLSFLLPITFALSFFFASPSFAEETEPNQLSPSELEEGWLLLFDGDSLYGWTKENEANWHVESGAIQVNEGEAGLLCTTTQWADFVLSIEVQAPRETQTGIFLRSRKALSSDEINEQGYAIPIAGPEQDYPTGSVAGLHRAETSIDSTEWFSMQIQAEGDSITVSIGGEVVATTDRAGRPRSGFIGLQFSPQENASGKIAFRNIKIKPLNIEPIFNGRDLEGWDPHEAMAGRFSVLEEGILHVENGKGQIESEALFADFILQLECQVNGEGLNSGIFFRCIPGEEMNGYESQIQNQFLNSDRSQPADCGTGGIFRRQNARQVIADDFTWFYKTIHAQGPHMAIWVNGILVTDWTDRREEDPNPRRGLRLAPGSIMIQAHDPTTDLYFRHIRASELPPRWPSSN